MRALLESEDVASSCIVNTTKREAKYALSD